MLSFGKIRRTAKCFIPMVVAGLALTAVQDACSQTFYDGTERSAPVRDPDHVFGKEVTSWWDLKWQNMVKQQQDYSCGAAALATVVRYFWNESITEREILEELDDMLSAEEIRDRLANGLTITDLRRVSVKMDFAASLLDVSFTKLSESKVPVIVGITARGYDHFVVYRGADGRYVYLADPIRGNIRVEIPEFLEQWQENTILVVAEKEADVPEVSPLSVSCEEISTGWLNRQYIRSRAPHVQPPLVEPVGP